MSLNVKKELLNSYNKYFSSFRLPPSPKKSIKIKIKPEIRKEKKSEDYFKLLNIMKLQFKKYSLNYKAF